MLQKENKMQTKKKVWSLIKEYDFLTSVVNFFDQKEVIVDIKFKRIDSNLLYLRLDKDNSIYSRSDVPEKSFTKEVNIYIINNNNELVRIPDYSYLPKTVIGTIDDLNIADIKYIIIKNTYYWYKNTNLYEDIEKLKFISKEINVVVYERPTNGLKNLIKKTNIESNILIDDKEILKGFMNGESDYDSIQKKLISLSDRFSYRIYIPYLREVIDASRKKGMSGKFDSIKVSSYSMVGRIMITLERDNNTQITFIGAEDEDNPRIGYKSFLGTYDQLEDIVETLLNSLKELQVPLNEIYKDDENATIF